jgi:hypothetical protein
MNGPIKIDFFPGMPFQPNLMFESKARAYLIEALFRPSTNLGSWPNQETLQHTGEACQGQKLFLIGTTHELQRKLSFVYTAPNSIHHFS